MIPGLSRIGLDPLASRPLWLGGGLAELEATLASVLGGDVAAWALDAQPIGTLAVALTAPDGTPLAGVTVRVTPWQAFGSADGVVPLLAQEVVTDAQGMALLALPQTGSAYRFRMSADVDAERVLDVELRLPETTGLAHANARGQRWH